MTFEQQLRATERANCISLCDAGREARLEKSRYARFAAKYVVNPDSDCWEWTAAMKENGYGAFMWAKGNCGYAHRAAWRLAKGDIPPGKYVCHACDNRRCVNPAHLFLGTPQDNFDDMVAKGRARGAPLGGDHHPIAKLTDADVVRLRDMASSGASSREIASAFCIDRTYALAIARGAYRKKAGGPLTRRDVRGRLAHA